MLLAVLPHTIVDAPVLPPEHSAALPLVIHKLPFIALAIAPYEGSIPMHLIPLPLSLVHLAIRPNILANARYFIILKRSGVGAAICEGQAPIAVLLALLVLALVLGAVGPLLHAASMLLIFDPLAHVGGAIRMLVGAVAVRFVVRPRALVNVAIGVNQYAVPVCLVVLPLPIILAAILPHLLPVAILHAVEQLARVYCAVAQRYRPIILPLLIIHHFARYAGDVADGRTAAILIHDGAGAGRCRIVVEDGEDACGYSLSIVCYVGVAHLPLIRSHPLRSPIVPIMLPIDPGMAIGIGTGGIILVRASEAVRIIILILHIVHPQLILGIFLHGHADMVLRHLLPLLIDLRIVF